MEKEEKAENQRELPVVPFVLAVAAMCVSMVAILGVVWFVLRPKTKAALV